MGIRFLLILSCLFTSSVHAFTILELNNGWDFHEKGTLVHRSATVPGTIHTDLYNWAVIGDPFYSTNEAEFQWIETKTWEYSSVFICSKELLKEKHIELQFDGLDTYADVFLNDSLRFTAEDMFLSYKIDIKNLVKGKNRLRVVFHPASELIERKTSI